MTSTVLFKFPEFRDFWKLKKCPIFWKISHQHQKNFSIVCIMLSSAHIKSFIYFSLSIPVVLKWTHPQNEQNRSSTLGPLHLNSMDILRSVFTRGFYLKNLFKVPRKSWMDYINGLNPLIYCHNWALLKDGLVQHVLPSITTKGGAFVY